MTKMHKLLATCIGAAMVLTLGGAALASSSKTVTKTGSEPTTAVNATAEAPEAEAGESSEPDGPGGHEDPPGNVDHQFEGEE